MFALRFILIAISASIVPAFAAEFGAADDALGPLGGGAGYTRIVTAHEVLVNTEQGLIDALAEATAGQTIYVADDAELDFSPWVWSEKTVLRIPEGVTLASGRGKDGSEGALIVSTAFETRPLIEVAGPDVRITGLRIQGPDTKIRHEPLDRWIKEGAKEGTGRTKYYAFPTSDGIQCAQPNLEVDNCEISGWSHGAVYLQAGAENAHIHHNFIHHNQRAHLGYGVVIDQATPLIESNRFDHNRHSIASTGRPGSGYEARNNWVGPNASSHLFDMHGGRDRKDGTDIAGDWMKVHHNTFESPRTALVVRGTPQGKVEVHHNVFVHPDQKAALRPHEAEWLEVGENTYGVKE
jgi:hypothetical protein